MGKFLRYADYKVVDVEWLDTIPAHWQYTPLKHVVITKITDGPHETPEFIDDGVIFISAEAIKDNKIDFSKKRGFISPELHATYSKKCLPERGDIFMVKSGNTTGAIAMVETDKEFSIWSPLALIRVNHIKMDGRFLFYVMCADFFQKSIQLSWSQGTQPNIGMGVIENLITTSPPIVEQRIVSSFLDHETAKIDLLIAKQERLIELLKGKRQAVISHAVTKGLNPDAPMKDSGVEWLGEVPAHWIVSRIGWEARYLSYGFTNPMPTTDEGPYMLTANDIGDGSVLYNQARCTSSDAYSTLLTFKSKPNRGDILITKDGTLGRIAVHDGTPACINQSVALLRIKDSTLIPEFTALALMGSVYQNRMIYEAGGTTIKHIYISRLSQMTFAYPGKEEQQEILDGLHSRLLRMDTLIGKATSAIALMQEHRTALISAAVTGKINVRGWQKPATEPEEAATAANA